LNRKLTFSESFAGAVKEYEAGRLPEAQALCRQTLAGEPQHADALHLLGVIAYDARQYRIAVGFVNKAIALDGTNASFHNSLGRAYRRLGRFDEAAESQRRAIALDPVLVDAHSDLGSVFYRRGDIAAAVEHFQRALAIDPQHAKSHVRLARTALITGDFATGWREYEWRWLTANFPSKNILLQRQWRGEPLDGAQILIQCEQGFGDTLQFVRFAPLVAARGGRVVLEVQPELHRLLCRLPGVGNVIVLGAERPDCAWRCLLISLPHIFRMGLETIPNQVPYIGVNPTEARAWAARLGGSAPRVGLVWAGDSNHPWDQFRSLHQLSRLAPLAAVDGVAFFSLQKGPAAAQAASPPAGMRMVDLSPHLHDFADTAAAITSLDLVITTCTSAAHLAGTLGKPVWILLQYAADWIWLLDREDSPWYPTARLFRQPTPGAWSPVIERVAGELRRLAAGDQSVLRPPAQVSGAVGR
jgi:tetratricopeptide (TPR) repeat protein